MKQLEPLLQAIAAVAQSDERPRAQVEAALAQLEQRGFHLTAAVQEIWAGQRDPAVLTAGLDDTDTALVQRILALLEPSATEALLPSVKPRQTGTSTSSPRPPSTDALAFRRAAALANAQAKVAAVGADPQARADLAARFRAMADLHAQGKYADFELAAQLRVLAEQLTR